MSFSSPQTTPIESREPCAALESSYVHLNTQLLLQLQSRRMEAALQTAEAIRELCERGTPLSTEAELSEPALRDAVRMGAKLFHGSPAALLLSMRSELQPTPSRSPTQHSPLLQPPPPPQPSSSSSEFVAGSAISAAATNDDAATRTSRDTSTTATPNTASSSPMSSPSSAAEDISSASSSMEESVGRTTPSTRSFLLLAEALTAWGQLPLSANPQEGSMGEERVAKQSETIGAHSPAAARMPRRPPSPVPTLPPHRLRSVNTTQSRDAAEEGKNTPVSAAILDADTETEEVWEQMQQQVAKEMERLAVVRKHR